MLSQSHCRGTKQERCTIERSSTTAPLRKWQLVRCGHEIETMSLDVGCSKDGLSVSNGLYDRVKLKLAVLLCLQGSVVIVSNISGESRIILRIAYSFTRSPPKNAENVIPTKNTVFFGKTRFFWETPHFRFQAFSHTFLQFVIRSQKISKASSQPQNLPSPSPFALVTKPASHSPLVFRNSNLKEGGPGPECQKYHGFMTLVKHQCHDEGVLASNSAQAQAKTVLLLTTSLFSSNILEIAHSWLNPKTHRSSTVCHALLRVFHGLATG